MTLSIIDPTPSNSILTSVDLGKDRNSRLKQYQDWLDSQNLQWFTPDLAAYRDTLLDRKLSPSSVSAHLSSIRARYTEILRTDAARNLLYDIAGQHIEEGSYADRAALVNEKMVRIQNALDPKAAPVKQVTKQDVAESEHLRLTKAQANALIAAPGINNLMGLRDTAMIALMLCTGIREQELCDLKVSDLRQKLGGALALLVREGKGAKQRLIPYGALEQVLLIVDKWLKAAGIHHPESYVFRGFYNNGKTIRPEQLTTRQVQRIIGSYPIMVDGQATIVRPHDLRRTYARRLYEADVNPVAIQQNLGHSDLKTTLGYIGVLDADQRKPPMIYDLSIL